MATHRIRWYLSIASIVFVAILMRPMPASAEAISLTTSPVTLNLVIKPGSSDTRTLQLMNNSTQAVKITMGLEVFSADGTSGQATITQPLPGDHSVDWVSFSPSSFTAQPGVWSSVKMTINLPTTASLGYYYAVLFKPDITDQPSARTTVVKGSNGILVLVDTQSGNESRQVSLNDFTVSQGLYEYLPASFTVSVHNGGNIYLAPFGSVYISRTSDGTKSIAALDINPNSGNVLPRSNRSFQVQWTDGFPVFEDKTVNGQVVRDKQGNPVQQLSWSFAKLSKVRFGKYYAKVTLIYSDGKRVVPLTKVVSFWVIPWKLILLFVAAIVVVVVGLSTIGRFVVRLIRRVHLP